MSMRVRVISQRIRVAYGIAADVPGDAAYDAGGGADAEQDKHNRNPKFHRESKPGWYGDLEDDDRGADHQHRQRVAESPYDADSCGRADAMFAAQDGGDRDYVVRIGCMAHSQQQPEQRNSQGCGIAKIHLILLIQQPQSFAFFTIRLETHPRS